MDTETAEPDLFDRITMGRQGPTDPYTFRSAIMSKPPANGKNPVYRFALERVWDEDKPLALWIMLNPSTADAFKDDPTIGRCVSFARTYGMGAIRVVNLFAYRATSPDDLWSAAAQGVDIVGPQNRELLVGDLAGMNSMAGLTIVAWGAQPDNHPIGLSMVEWVREHYYGAWCLGKTKSGQPKHPLYINGATPLDPW
jgi:hypothetical protein